MTGWMLGWILEGSWMDFERILGGFWEAFGSQDGSKIIKKSNTKHNRKNNPKKEANMRQHRPKMKPKNGGRPRT